MAELAYSASADLVRPVPIVITVLDLAYVNQPVAVIGVRQAPDPSGACITGRKIYPSVDPLSRKEEKHIRIRDTSANQLAFIPNFSLNGGPPGQARVGRDDGYCWLVGIKGRASFRKEGKSRSAFVTACTLGRSDLTVSSLTNEMADKHPTGNLDGSTDVSLADGQSIRERNNMALESEKQVEAGQPDDASRDEQATVHEPIADEKAAVDTALEKADSGDVTDEKKIENEEEEEQLEYPAKWRLALITIALCLSVFCMALV